MRQDELDEVIGITRCARCGHRLNGEVECPVCSGFYNESRRKERLPKWVYFIACFLTSPLSLYFILRSRRLSRLDKLLAASGGLLWASLYLF